MKVETGKTDLKGHIDRYIDNEQTERDIDR